MEDYELRSEATTSSTSAGLLLERVDSLRQRCTEELNDSHDRAARFGRVISVSVRVVCVSVDIIIHRVALSQYVPNFRPSL